MLELFFTSELPRTTQVALPENNNIKCDVTPTGEKVAQMYYQSIGLCMNRYIHAGIIYGCIDLWKYVF